MQFILPNAAQFTNNDVTVDRICGSWLLCSLLTLLGLVVMFLAKITIVGSSPLLRYQYFEFLNNILQVLSCTYVHFSQASTSLPSHNALEI